MEKFQVSRCGLFQKALAKSSFAVCNNPNKEVLLDHLGYQDEHLKMFHIEEGGGRHLEFREMLNVVQVATKLSKVGSASHIELISMKKVYSSYHCRV